MQATPPPYTHLGVFHFAVAAHLLGAAEVADARPAVCAQEKVVHFQVPVSESQLLMH